MLIKLLFIMKIILNKYIIELSVELIMNKIKLDIRIIFYNNKIKDKFFFI